ncbi:MAG: N-acetyl-gamma-glutamyl-phosphate reductase [Legionellales bacterium]|nr:N-acetyl-gamma-glutamyl-phosphate reductase [Legionellales bacterium]
MIKVGIIGATGYTGVELTRLLHLHPQVKITHLGTESYTGQSISEIYPHFQKHVEDKCISSEIETLIANCDVVFIALPHGKALFYVEPLLAAGKKIIDLGADFRLRNPEDYQQWYEQEPAPAELQSKAVYGLAEAGYREAIKHTALIANPGCYPTASILAAIPAFNAEIVLLDDCIFDAKSGISGAGRSLQLRTHFCEISDNFLAYQVAGIHRHTPEIEQELTAVTQHPVTIQFTPHLIPVVRGLYVTAYFKLKNNLSQTAVHELYQQFYQDERFIRVRKGKEIPEIKHVRGSNYCDLSVHVDPRTQRLIVISVIDNLIKGAAGQAIQNMNLMFQLPEEMGLEAMSQYP